MIHHIFNFDVNGTITLEDTSKKVSKEHLIISLLAENTFAEWSNNSSMSYKDYVYTVLLPGDKSDPVLKEKRENTLGAFLNTLEQTAHPLYEHVRQQLQLIKQKYTDENGEIKFTIFPSFFSLIEKLNHANASYSIVLRTFGKDLDDVVGQMERHPTQLKFHHWGKFENGTCIINEKTIEKTSDLFRQIIHSRQHFAIVDDWASWNRDGEHSRSAKPFILDVSGTLDGVRNCSWFLDDNITHSPHDIICPQDVGGEPLEQSMVRQCALRVNTLSALLDDDYFCKLIQVQT